MLVGSSHIFNWAEHSSASKLDGYIEFIMEFVYNDHDYYFHLVDNETVKYHNILILTETISLIIIKLLISILS